MKTEFVASRLDIKAFAQAAGQLAAQDTLQKYERLMQDTQGLGANLPLIWAATGELRPVLGEPDQIWLHLKADATLPLTCQRCLGPVDVRVSVDRAFRFVADEETAAAQDDDFEEELLVVSHDLNLTGLIEDELLMELPHVPRHEVCPTEVKLAVADEAFEAEMTTKPNPFAVLAKLKDDKAN